MKKNIKKQFKYQGRYCIVICFTNKPSLCFQIFYMLFPINSRKERKDLDELASLKNQVEEFRLKDKLGKQKFYENVKKFELLTDTIENI